MKHTYFLRRLLLTLWLASFALGAAAQAPGGGNTGGPPGSTPGGGTTPGAPGGGNTGGPPSPNAAVATITGFSPTSGPVGTVVTVTGTNLTGTTSVAFNGVNAPTFTVNSATQLTVTVPTGATTGPISAVTPGGAVSSGASFTVVQPPVVSSFAPVSGAPGTSITITGSGFSGATAVTFNGTAAPYSVASATSITATVPAGASTGPIQVTTPAGSGTSSSSFVVPTAPVLSGLRLHLRADAGVSTTGGGVSGWQDQSGNDFHTAQASAGQRPALAASAVNGLPALTLDGADDFLQSTASVDLLGGQTSYTFFVVAKPGATQKSYADIFDYSHSNGVRFVIQQDGANTNTFYNNGVTAVNQTLSAAGFSVYGGTLVNGGTATSRLNGLNPLSGTASSNSFPQPAAFRVGNWISGGREFNGQIAEVLVYNRALSQTELEQVESYLITKYGITIQPTLTTGTITPQSFCAGSTISVPFSTSVAAYQAGNQFKLQLSDANGVFDPNAPLFGTLLSSGAAGGTVSGVVPATTAGGTGYRVRVVASSPATVGTDNGTDLTINPAPVSQAGGPASVAYGGSIPLTLTPTFAGATYSWSGPLGFASTQQNPTIASSTNVGVNRYTCVVTLNGCSYSSFVDVTVQAPTAPLLTLSTFAGPLCPSTPFTLSFSVSGVAFAAGNTITAQLSDASGSFAAPTTIGSVAFSGQGSGTLQATLPAATAGSSGYRIRLVGSSPASTSNDNGSNLTVNTPPTVTLAAFAPVCINASAFALSGGLPAGGTYRVNGAVASSFNPVSAGAGSYTITYTYTAASGCASTATQTLTVQPLPTVTLAALAPACLDAPAYALTGGAPTGGSYSGPGVSGGQFNPATAGVGTHTITYSYTDGSGCSASATRTLQVLPLPTLAATSTLVCAGQPVTLTVSNAGSGASYSWSTGATTASIIVNPTVATTYSVSVTNAAGCVYPLSRAINIRPNTSTPGAVSQMQPVDNAGGLSLPIAFSWAPGADADSYDLYVWPENGTQPAAPTVAGLTSLAYNYSGPIPYGQGYKWRVVSRTPCGSTDGPVQTFRLRQLPDVYVSHIVVPDTAYANQQIEIEWNVTNAGLGSTLAQQWTDEVYVSQDSVFSLATAVSLGRRGNTTYLQPNGTYITTATFPVQLSQAGRYYVFVRADVYNQLLESNENNNRRRAADRVLIIVPETPDFSLENFVSPPDNSIGYTDVQLRYRVFNRGTVPVTQPRYDEYFISPDTIMNIAQNTGRLALGPNAISLGRQRVTDTLMPGGFYQRIVTVRIPHTQYGTRYFYAYTDTDNQIFEVASTNNANKPVPVNVVLRPPVDLAPFRLTAPAATVAGVPMTVTWDVRNDGLNAPVAEERYWADQFWLSPTATFDPTTAISVGTLNLFGGDTLQPGHHYRRSVTLNIPNGLSGQYYVFGKADHAGLPTSNGNVFEYIYEANNIIRSGVVNVGLAYADLEPAVFTAPATIDAFQTFTVNYTVRNNSSAPTPATGTWSDEVHITTPDNPGYLYCGSLVGRVTHTGPLAPGQSYSGTMTLTIPRWVEPGQYDLVFSTDQGNQVYEFNFDGNNTARQRITYRYSDDLRLTALSAGNAAFSGQNLQVSWQVDNQGAFRTLATAWFDQLFLSTDAVLDNSDLSLTTVTRTGDLAVGSSYGANATVRIPHGLQGSYYLIARTGNRYYYGCGDYTNGYSNVLVDSNPANNVRTLALPITLTPPCDLVVQSVTFPTDVVAGQQVQIPFTIKNQGVGATLEGEWNDGIYLNTSPTVNGATRIGNFRRTAVLGAGQSYSVLQNVTIPAYMSGNYYIFLVTDNNSPNGYTPSTLWGGNVQYGQVYEHQAELNNIEQSNLLIRVPAPADLVVTSVAVPGSKKLGETMTVHYQVKNQGANPAVGLLKDGLFLSQDLVLDGAVDRIFAASARNITIQPNQTISGVVKSHVQAVNPGAYNGMMATNLYDDIYEGPANNNNVLVAGNQLQVTVDDLPLRTTQPFALDLDSMVFYRVTPGAGKDMVLQLGSNQQFGQNEVYVAYNRVPTASDFDYIYESQVSPTQELLIPSTGPQPYYVLVKTPYVYAGLQTATLRADTLGFQVRSITANRVGQGRVTTRILGANFNRNTRFYLTRGADTTRLAVATLIRFRSSVDVTVRWFLDSLAIGQYNVVAQNGLRRVQLTDGLTVEPKRALSVDFATITPRTVRVGTSANWTYFLKNTSNVDVPYWEFQYNVPAGSNPVITHTPNVRKKSDFTASPASATTRNRLQDGIADVLPFVARDLVPDEVIQVNLRLTPPAIGNYPVVWNQAALNEEWYTRQTLDHIQRYRQAVLANPAQFPASVASLAANQVTWQDSLRRYYQRQGLLDASWLGRPARTGYTALSDSVKLPGGICTNTWNLKECPTPFRPDPFGAAEYPASLIGCADSIVFTYKGRGATCTQVVGSSDPNLIVGPSGLGKRKMVGVQQTLNYQVQFENDPLLATAPAQVVRITVPLSAAFEPRAFRLGDFGWGTYRFSVPTGSASYTRLLDMPDSLGYDVRVVGTVDVVNRRLLWQMETIDPNTGLAPTDPNKGFLLINDSTGRGQGFVDFTIKGAASAFTGDTLAARASIVFDTNEPILTNRWWNILDAVAPSSHVAALPASSAQPEVQLSWTAGDDPTGSGLQRYALYAAQDRGPFVRVADNLSTRSYTFVGQPGSRYDFFTLATDSTDNQETLKTLGEAFTVIEESLDIYDLTHNQCLVSDTIVSTGTGQWQYLRLSGKVVAAVNDQGRALGKVAVQFTIQEGLPTRADTKGTEYFDRNWKLYAQNTFAGNSVKVRFYGLSEEFDRFKAANDGDGNDVQTTADLRLTQYSGPNEDCLLSNDDFGPASQVRLLTPTTTAGPANAPKAYFVAEATVFDHFSEFYLNGGTAPLPVTLTRFGAVRQGADVRLSWQTAQEKNSAYFAVEASAEPQQGFREVTRVAARGNSSSLSSYEALDRQVPTTGGLRYYRLRQVDQDGTTTYSPIVAVTLDKAPLAVRALPNPFRQAELQVTLELPEAAPTELLISDLAGRTVLRRTLDAPAGTTTVALPELARLTGGVYVLTVKAGPTVRQLKLLKD